MEEKLIKEKLNKISKVFSALSNPWRIYILFFIYKKNKISVKELSNFTGYSQPFVSQALQRLKAEGIVNCERKGQKVYYQVNNLEILEVLFNCIGKELE